MPTSTDPESAPGQAYRELAASLQSVLNRTGTRALAVTSPEPGDGKTLTSVNLAVAMGESGEHVVLVDADGRQRGLSQLCDLDGQPGLTDLGVDATPIDYCLWLPTFTSIQVIPAGAPVTDTTGFLEGPAFSKAMFEVRQHAGLTLVDAPPLLSAPDALAIAEQVEGVVLVVRPETSATTLIEARQRLDGAGARLLGYVVNRNSARRNRRAVVGGDGHEPAGAAKELQGSVRLAGHANEAQRRDARARTRTAGSSRGRRASRGAGESQLATTLPVRRSRPHGNQAGTKPHRYRSREACGGSVRVDRLPVGWDEGPGLVASVWRFRWLVAAVALAGALAGVGFSTVQPVMYEGSSRILLARQSGQSRRAVGRA